MTAELSVTVVPSRLEVCEASIAAAAQEMRSALREIREDRLYLEAGYDSFEDYCEERWSYTRRHVDRLIAWDRVEQVVKPLGLQAPERESHIRPIADLPELDQVAVWKEAVESAPDTGVTAAHVEATRVRILGESSPEQREVQTVSRRALTSSASVEWYTPADHIERGRRVLGTIDLDPASCAAANERVKARKFYTRDDDGLTQPWFGRVFANPPNGTHADSNDSMQGLFVDRLVDSFNAGDVVEGLITVNAATGARWFEALWRFPICFLSGRPAYVRPNGEAGPHPTHFRVWAYVGPEERWAAFEAAFGELGEIRMPPTRSPLPAGACPVCRRWVTHHARWSEQARENAARFGEICRTCKAPDNESLYDDVRALLIETRHRVPGEDELHTLTLPVLKDLLRAMNGSLSGASTKADLVSGIRGDLIGRERHG